ncbi:lymphocyte antigen 75-like [Engraulis encrasicolus]|uniref:lymphocyte antigen 75-like n=1 Tax=Engraulis encrasicolus TaxID=184585 RepID=UPI002FD56978
MDLATVTDSNDVKSLNNLGLAHHINNTVWIGLYNNVHDWASEIVNLSTPEKTSVCIYNGKWRSVGSSSDLMSYVCRNESQTENHGFNINKIPPANWTEAQRLCQLSHMRLATMKNQAEIAYLGNTLGRVSVWVDPYGEGWSWSDSTKVSFINWLDNHEQFLRSEKRCAVSLQTATGRGRGGWVTKNCTEKFPFVCNHMYKSVTRMQDVRVELDVDSGLDINSEEVQQALLNQIKKRMEANGLPAGVKLSWRKQKDGQVFHKKKAEKRGSAARKKKDEF